MKILKKVLRVLVAALIYLFFGWLLTLNADQNSLLMSAMGGLVIFLLTIFLFALFKIISWIYED